MGGGENHRMDLSSMVLIKDNHLMVCEDIKEAVRRARKKAERGVVIEVEVTNYGQAKDAVQSGADWIMLDNMPLAQMKKIVDWVDGRLKIEVSGNVDLDNVRKIAKLGVDYISVGKLTHSYSSVDLSLEFLGVLFQPINRAELEIRRRKVKR
jgi:nicotinate-nucleotide pyrophosphorylase (carboxylating)